MKDVLSMVKRIAPLPAGQVDGTCEDPSNWVEPREVCNLALSPQNVGREILFYPLSLSPFCQKSGTRMKEGDENG